MLIRGLYEPENIKRVRTAHVVVAVLTLVIGGYMAVNTICSLREVWGARSSLNQAKSEAADLSRKAAKECEAETLRAKPDNGGVDAFAVTFAGWAKSKAIYIESFTPEGAPAPSEVASGGVKLGVWNASKVRVKGRGDYRQLMSLLDEFQSTTVPVKLESFALQSLQQADKVGVVFDLLLTVYERPPEAGPQSNGAGKTNATS